MQLVMFSKHLAPLSVPDAAKVVKELGFQGLDLTVRPQGHVLPEKVKTDLPAAVRSLADQGLSIPMITTGITGADEPHAEAILASAASLGIRNLKLGYWRYGPFGKLLTQIDAARKKMDGLEALARKHDVRVSLHIHSGDYLTAEAGNVYLILKDRDPHHVGAYLDPGHMTLEGGLGGWKQGIDLLQGYISMVAVKSFGHYQAKNGATGEGVWHPKLVPLKEGTVRWREVFQCLKQVGWDGVVTFHSEYQGSSSLRDLSHDELIVQTREDLHYLRPIIRDAGYPV